MGITHMVVGATAVSLGLQSADPALLFTGAIASLLPDIDISVSPAGRVFPWVSRWLERRFPHRSCTHSLVASGAVALATYPAAIMGYLPLSVVHAINIGYFAGWFADAFTRSGVEMLWPSPVRCVLPGNRDLRLRTNSPAEYGLLVVFVAIAFFSFNINANGGIITQFNRLIASTTGVEQLYNEKGASHQVIAHIKGVRVSDRTPVEGDFQIIQGHGQGFLVQGQDGAIYKVGTEPDVQVTASRIVADAGPAATTAIEPMSLEEEQLSAKLSQFERAGAKVFVSGRVNVDDPDSLRLSTDPHQFPIISLQGNFVSLSAAPLELVRSQLGEQFATGQLSIRSIYAQPKTSASLSSQP